MATGSARCAIRLRRPPRRPGRLLRGWLAALCAGTAAAACGADTPASPPQDGDSAAFDLSLEQLRSVKVLTATKTATPYYDAPAIVTLVTADDIARYGYGSVAEALSHKAGFVESNDGLNHNFGVRGISAGAQSASRGIKIMLDGQPIAFRSTQQQLIGYEFVPMTMIERIEIVRGPVSVLYGADALLAAVNIITRRQGGEQRLAASHERGAAGRSASVLSGSGNLQLDRAWLAWGLQAARADRAGLRLPRMSPDYQRYAAAPFAPVDNSDPFSLYLRAGWENGVDDVGASVFWQRQDSDHVFSSLNPLLQPPSHVALSQGYARVNYARALDAHHTLRASLSYGEGSPAGGDYLRAAATDYVLLRDAGYRALEGSVEWLWQLGEGNSLLVGVDALRDRETLESFRRHSLTDGSDFQLSQPGTATLRNSAVYLQWQAPLTAHWSVIAGGRRDRHSVYGGQPSYRAGLVGKLAGGWRLKLLTGTAFQAPSAELLYRGAVQPGDVRGNPDLAPQKSRTAEVQLMLPPSASWNAALTLYHTRVAGLVTLEQAFFNLVARNSSDADVNGAEIELRYQHDWLTVNANASHAAVRRGVNRYTLAPLAQRPQGELFPGNSANLGASAALPGRKLVLSAQARYVGTRPAATANVLLANQDYQLGSYVDATLALRWLASHNATASLTVRDAGNRRHVDPGVGGIDYPSPGRRYGVQVEYRF